MNLERRATACNILGLIAKTISYAAALAGWFFAALSNSTITQYLDIGHILCLGAGFQILAHVLRVWDPPLALYIVTFFFASLGQAYNDTQANTFVSTLKGAHRYLAFIHAMYMAGCLVGPFVATGFAGANGTSRWYIFYSVPLGLCVVNLALVWASFCDRMANQKLLQARRPGQSRSQSKLWEMKRIILTKEVWLVSLFFFFFLGATITSSGKPLTLVSIV